VTIRESQTSRQGASTHLAFFESSLLKATGMEVRCQH